MKKLRDIIKNEGFNDIKTKIGKSLPDRLRKGLAASYIYGRSINTKQRGHLAVAKRMRNKAKEYLKGKGRLPSLDEKNTWKAIKLHLRSIKKSEGGWKRIRGYGYFLSAPTIAHLVTNAHPAMTAAAAAASALPAAAFLHPHYKMILQKRKYLNDLDTRKLHEVFRPLARATKLATNLANRYKSKEISGMVLLKDGPFGAPKHVRDAIKDHMSGKRTFPQQQKTIPVNSIRKNQNWVGKDTLMNYVKKQGNDEQPITVYHHQGQHYLGNGRHRLLSAKIRGDTHIKANVVHLPEE